MDYHIVKETGMSCLVLDQQTTSDFCLLCNLFLLLNARVVCITTEIVINTATHFTHSKNGWIFFGNIMSCR